MQPDGKLLQSIAETEWTMFTQVNRSASPSPEEKEAFLQSRQSQFAAWSPEAAASYWQDLQQAQTDGRNLVLEKYVFMMKSTMPSHYQQVAHLVTEPAGEKRELVEALTEKLVTQTSALFAQYPHVAGAGRPVSSREDDQQNTSVETYQRGELSTYSVETLQALLAHFNALEAQGVSLSQRILENTVKFYGYDSLETAEAATAQRMDHGIQIGYKRCPACS